jgi:penicillin-binding protein 1C
MLKIFKNKKLVKNAAMLLGSVGIFLSGVLVLFLFSMKIPDFQDFGDRKVINSTQIYDRTGKVLLYDIHENIKRTYIPFDQMNASIKNATVAIEDAEFYNHNGIRITSIIRAILSNLGGGRTQGGSTITQQLIKNTLLTQGHGYQKYIRKIKEWVLAVKIDKAMSKEKILEYYLNEVPYGGTIYGIEAAANTYFGKKAVELTTAEAAYLASIPQSPTILSPYGKHKDRLEARKNLVLDRMLALGFITEEEFATAKNEVVNFIPQASSGIKAAHFVFFIKEYLEEKYGPEAVGFGGLKVITTIDAELQAKAEEIVKTGALENEKAWNGKNAALVAIDPKTGQILTLVGSRDYFDKNIDGNFNVATASRQPGSSFKPFIYATAFNKGFTADTVLFDVPTEFQSTCDPYGRARAGHSQDECYMPQNYDGAFRGPMKLRDALAQSINVPAVKLFYLAGMSDSLKTAESMGISTLEEPGRYGLTLVIGGGEVTLLDMTSAYGVFANSGIRNPYTGILRIENLQGETLEEWHPEAKEVLPKNTALVISDILSNNSARIPTFGANSPLNVPGYEVAAKTGTTNDNKDAWILGYTPSLVVGVWAGNNDNVSMKKGGAAMAGPIWNKFMKEALAKFPNESFEEPEPPADPFAIKPVLRGSWQGNDVFLVDKVSGNLATPETPQETLEERAVTEVHSILYWVDRNDITGPPPANPGKDYQFNNWETAVQNWWAKNRYGYSATTWNDKPVSTDNIHTDSLKPKVTILSPKSSAVYPQGQRVVLSISSSGPYPIQKMEVFINDSYIDSLTPPWNFSFVPEDIENLREVNELKLVYYDTVYNRGETSTSFRISAE